MERLIEALKHGNQVKEEMFRKDLDDIRRDIAHKNDEIN